MRVAVSGSHGTGKSTLIAAFAEQRPEYVVEPEAFETLGDDIDLDESGGPTSEGLHRLLDHTAGVVAAHAPGACVVHERSPVDYLAYAAASRRGWGREGVAGFLERHVPLVRTCLRHLELIAFVPASAEGPRGRPREDARFRQRVDEELRRALIDDEYDLTASGARLRIVELPLTPARQLDELLRLTQG